MKMTLKSALTATAIAVGATAMFPGLANAEVGISIGIGPSSVYSPYGPNYSPYDGDTYYDPIYIGGSWYHGPYHSRMYNGERQFYVNGDWRRNEWRDNSYPDSITFQNGGYYKDRRYNGFDDADRINARFPSDNRDMNNNRDTRDNRDMRDNRYMRDQNIGYSPYEGDYYYDPIYISGSWYHGPYRWRMHNGERQYRVNGRWRFNEWRNGALPMSITFRNGGYYRDHRYDGFYGADRINARFHSDNRDQRDQNRRRDHQDNSYYQSN